LNYRIRKTASPNINTDTRFKVLNSLGPTESDTLGIAAATVAFKGCTPGWVVVHMSKGAGLSALAAADAKVGSNADIPGIMVFRYSPGRAHIHTGRLFTESAGDWNIVGFFPVAHHPYAREFG